MRFFKFILIVLIIAVIVFEVYFLLKENKSFKENNPDINTQNVSGEVINNEVSGEEVEPTKPIADVKTTVQDIDNIARLNIESSNVSTTVESVGLEVIGEKYKEMFSTLGTSSTTVTIQVAGTMIHLMPYSDFVNEEEFHYDEDGKLLLYVLTASGKGDKVKYYLNDKSIIGIKLYEDGEPEETVDTTSGEELSSGDVSGEEYSIINEVDIDEIQERGAYLYNKYLLRQSM